MLATDPSGRGGPVSLAPAPVQTVTVIVPVPVSPEVLRHHVVRLGQERGEKERFLGVVPYLSEGYGQGDVVVPD